MTGFGSLWSTRTDWDGQFSVTSPSMTAQKHTECVPGTEKVWVHTVLSPWTGKGTDSQSSESSSISSSSCSASGQKTVKVTASPTVISDLSMVKPGVAAGSCDGSSVGSSEGASDGSGEGLSEGDSVGSGEGSSEGDSVGSGDGSDDGSPEGSREGTSDGVSEGASVGTGSSVTTGGRSLGVWTVSARLTGKPGARSRASTRQRLSSFLKLFMARLR